MIKTRKMMAANGDICIIYNKNNVLKFLEIIFGLRQNNSFQHLWRYAS